MAEKDQVSKEKVEHSGLFDFKGFYSFAHSWFANFNYGVDEERYSEKNEGEKRSILIQWRAARKLSDYFKAEHVVKFDVSNLTDVEVEIDGKKQAMNKGKVLVDVTSTLIMDYDSKWDSSPFSRFWRDVYNKYIIPGRVNNAKERVAGAGKDFKEELKAFLELVGRR